MARKLNPEGLINEERYIFKDHAQYKDKVFETFTAVAKRNKMPCNIVVETYKSGGLLLNNKDVLLTIDGGYKPFCVLGATTYGNYLIITLYTLVEDKLTNKLLSAATGYSLTGLANFSGGNMLACRDMEAFVSAVSAALQESFAELAFVESKPGFLGVK